MMAPLPFESSKRQFLNEAFSRFAQIILTSIKMALSNIAPDKSARSRLHSDKLAPFKIHPCILAYLKVLGKKEFGL